MKRAAFALAVLCAVCVYPTTAMAATPINLGTAAEYSVIGGQTVTNTGPTTLAGGLGVSPGSAFTGFPPGVAAFTHAADAEALQAQTELTDAYLDAFMRPSTTVNAQLGGLTLVPGVYSGPSKMPLAITGTLTLDGPGTYIFQTDSTLVTASASRVALINGARACDVWWQVGSSATLGTGSTFVGTIMALTSITVTTGVTVEGRALARNGSVTLDSDVFLTPSCAPATTTTTEAPTTTGASTTAEAATTTASVPIVSGATTTCPGCAPTTIKATEPCRECAPGETSVKVGSTAVNVTDDSTAPESAVTCIPKPKKSREVLVGVCAAAITAVGCGAGARLLRLRRH